MVSMTLTIEELLNALEPLIRRVVKEELTEVVQSKATVFLPQDSPLYEDLQDLWERKQAGDVNFISHEEVWRESLSSRL